MSKRFTPLIALILIISVSALAQTEGYDSRSYARLNYISGEVHVQRAGDMGYEAGTVNLVLVEGDRLAAQNGRAEVNFVLRNVLRLDGFSQVEFAKLPRGEGDPFKLHLFSGSLYLRVSRMSSDKEFEVHTPDASLYVLTEGLYRVDVQENRETRFSVLEGEAETAGEERSVTLRRGQSVTALDGRFLSGPASLSASLDEFDRWSRSRDDLMARHGSGSSYLPAELSEYEHELAENGQWRYEPDYGYVWVPRIRYYDDWRPYSYGRWVWYPIIGWTWIPDEPWGWSVYHYGRWHWSLGLGWYWIPTRYWGPAWVHWYWDYHYVGWCPLNRWNSPTVVINNRFYGRYGRSDYSVHNRAMVVVHRRQLQAPRIASVALRGDALTRIGTVTLSARQPAIAPSVSRHGKLPAEASRTFALSRGRSVDRTFGGRDAVDQRARRSLEGSRSIRSHESSPGILPRTVGGNRTAMVRSGEGRVSREGSSGRTSGRIREYALPGGASGDPGRTVRSRPASPGGSVRTVPQIRSDASRSGRTVGTPPTRTRPGSSPSSGIANPGQGSRNRPASPAGSVRVAPQIRSQESRSDRTAGSPSVGVRQSEKRGPGEYPARSASRTVTPDRTASSIRQRIPDASGSRTAAVDSRMESRRGSAVPPSRSDSKPSYTRPSTSRTPPSSRPSSSSFSGRSIPPRSGISSPGRSRSTSPSVGPSRSSPRTSSTVSAPSRSSGSVSRSRSSSGQPSSSKNARGSRRRGS